MYVYYVLVCSLYLKKWFDVKIKMTDKSRVGWVYLYM